MNGWVCLKNNGFTIVELLVTIVVIGILATITIVSYNGMQRRAVESAAVGDLSSASKVMVSQHAFDGSYPTTLPASIKSSPNVTLSLVASTLPYYENVTPVQNGVLLSKICQDLVNEGKGRGTNVGGGTDEYITGCGNWNSGSMQVTGWTSRVFNTPVAANTFPDYAAAVPAGDAFHPNQQPVIRNFYNEMHARLLAQGGSYPITTFWDSWASPGNGVMYEALPTPAPAGSGATYCIQATTSRGQWHVRPDAQPTTGPC